MSTVYTKNVLQFNLVKYVIGVVMLFSNYDQDLKSLNVTTCIFSFTEIIAEA